MIELDGTEYVVVGPAPVRSTREGRPVTDLSTYGVLSEEPMTHAEIMARLSELERPAAGSTVHEHLRRLVESGLVGSDGNSGRNNPGHWWKLSSD